jgi:hypothetical protein
MIKLDNMFPIIHGGEETTATILGIHVYSENLYIPVIIASTDEFKVFQILPNGLKDAGKKTTEKFAERLSGNGINK